MNGFVKNFNKVLINLKPIPPKKPSRKQSKPRNEKSARWYQRQRLKTI